MRLWNVFPALAFRKKWICLFVYFVLATGFFFSTSQSLLFQMCGNGSEVAGSLLPQLRLFFGVLVKKSRRPPKATLASWSHEEQELYKDFRHDIQKAIEHLSLAVGNNLYPWVEEEFSGAFKLLESRGDSSVIFPSFFPRVRWFVLF